MVYADDIILVTSSVRVLQKSLEICRRELENLAGHVYQRKENLLFAHWPAG